MDSGKVMKFPTVRALDWKHAHGRGPNTKISALGRQSKGGTMWMDRQAGEKPGSRWFSLSAVLQRLLTQA